MTKILNLNLICYKIGKH